MRRSSRLPILVGIVLLLASGCARPVSPVAGPSAASTGMAASDGHGGVGDPGSPPCLVRLHFVGPVVTLDRQFRPRLERRADFYVCWNGTFPAPGDTVPAHSVLVSIRWRRAPSAGITPQGPDSTAYIEDAPVFADTSPARPSGEFTPGVHNLNLIVPERAGGGRISVWFTVDFSPTAWWAGPDPTRFPPASDGDGRAVDVTDWAHFTTRPAWPPDGRGYFGPDSFQFVPSQRRPVHDDFARRTFYEIYGDRIYARSEGDTVHLNAWVVLCTGGFDRDSRYTPIVVPSDPALPPGFASQPDRYPVLISQGFIGAPTAFRIRVPTKLDDGLITVPSETVPYPNFAPASVLREPHLAGYWLAEWPGKAYAVAMGVDAEGTVGRINQDVVALADRVDAGGGSPNDRVERQQILTFYVRGAAGTGPAQGTEASAGRGRGAARRN